MMFFIDIKYIIYVLVVIANLQSWDLKDQLAPRYQC